MAHPAPPSDPNYASSPTSYDNNSASSFPPGPSFSARPTIAASNSYTRRGLTTPASSQSPTSSAYATLSGRGMSTGAYRYPASSTRDGLSPTSGRPGDSLLPRRLPPRATRVLGAVVLLLVGWWAISGSSVDNRSSNRVTTRWWDPRSGGECWGCFSALRRVQCAGLRTLNKAQELAQPGA